MKLAIVTETFYPQIDGIVTRLTATIEWLIQEAGLEVLVIAPEMGITEYKGARVEGIPARSFFLYPGKKFAFPTRKVDKILKAFNPDLVHVVNPAFIGVSGVYSAKRNKWPLLASYHTHVPKYADYYKLSFIKPALWWYFRKLHNKADLNLCTSKSVAVELKEQRFHNVHVWKRGVDTKKYHPKNYDLAMRQRLTNGQPDQKLLLYVGRLAQEKELEKLRNVLEASESFSLALVGDGPHRAALEKHFKGTKTVFTGFMQGEELARAYASSDIFIFPSTTETLGLVILEAMASGLPIVAAKSGPTEEQINDGMTGVLYDPTVKGEFVRKVLTLEDEQFRQTLSEQARASSRQFSWEAQAEQLLGYYKEVFKVSESNLRVLDDIQ
ncbi:glycosyltransferase family 1 protein [Pullulanibacillus sp. KACC 23026]|uniref:glycosyltransferase family 4 protein n=1 Tax=Pullulanibacillus sp. KACC 23026 TaxID=3028315 RepID=UPI0023AF76F9|nr:glycosyltransferase family 1 protein [Pullulanibacillus sp. KACC 23026]WEG14901.1 glycosyltransferase family 1 protein [Pullulanibacillus sp. KACC 23026]